MATVWLVAVAATFLAGADTLGLILGVPLLVVAAIVTTTNEYRGVAVRVHEDGAGAVYARGHHRLAAGGGGRVRPNRGLEVEDRS